MVEPVRRNFVEDTDQKFADLNSRLDDAVLRIGPPDGTSPGMESRLTRLEVEGEQYRRDISEIKASLKKLDSLPTKQDLANYWVASIATGIAILALTVGGITGGLALIAKFAS